MAITDSSLSRNVFTEVRSEVVTALSGTGVSVNATYNDKTSAGSQVVMEPPRMTENEFSFNSTEGKKAITVVIDIFSDSAQDLDTYEDLIRTRLKQDNISGISLNGYESDYDFTQSQEDKLHLKTLSVGYVRE